jgi:hypothetical protein
MSEPYNSGGAEDESLSGRHHRAPIGPSFTSVSEAHVGETDYGWRYEQASTPAEATNIRGETPPLRHWMPRSRRTRAVAAIGVAAAAVAVIIVAVSSSHGAPFAGSAVGATATAQTATGLSANGVPTAGALAPGPMPGAPSNAAGSSHTTGSASSAKGATGPKPLQPTDPVQVKSWNAGQAGKAMAKVTAVAGTVLMAHGSGQYPQMLQACKTLAGAVQTAAALPPIPDAAMFRYYQKSLDAFKSGIADCEAGITQHEEGVEDTVTQVNQTDTTLAVKRFGTGMTDLYIATDYLRKH